MRIELEFQILALQPRRIILTHRGYTEQCRNVKRWYK